MREHPVAAIPPRRLCANLRCARHDGLALDEALVRTFRDAAGRVKNAPDEHSRTALMACTRCRQCAYVPIFPHTRTRRRSLRLRILCLCLLPTQLPSHSHSHRLRFPGCSYHIYLTLVLALSRRVGGYERRAIAGTAVGSVRLRIGSDISPFAKQTHESLTARRMGWSTDHLTAVVSTQVCCLQRADGHQWHEAYSLRTVTIR